MPSFLRTVTERRDLAGLVRRVFAHPFLLEKWFVMVDGEVDQAGAAAAIATLHHSARLLGIRPENYLNQFYPKQTPGTKYITHEMLKVTSSQLLGLVIAALPNMEHLSLQSSRPSVEISATALEAPGFTGLRLKTLEVFSSHDAVTYWQGRRMFNMFNLHNEGQRRA